MDILYAILGLLALTIIGFGVFIDINKEETYRSNQNTTRKSRYFGNC